MYMYLWIPTPCLNAFWHAVPTYVYIFGNVFIILFVYFFVQAYHSVYM